MKKEIIILTKSDKRAGYCIAGIDKETGEWVRVISSNWMTEHAVPGSDLVCDDGKEVDIYNVVEIEFIKAVPTNVQPENYLYMRRPNGRKKEKAILMRFYGFMAMTMPIMFSGILKIGLKGMRHI